MLPFCKTQTQTISMLSYLFRAGVELDLRTAGKFWGIIIILFFFDRHYFPLQIRGTTCTTGRSRVQKARGK